MPNSVTPPTRPAARPHALRSILAVVLVVFVAAALTSGAGCRRRNKGARNRGATAVAKVKAKAEADRAKAEADRAKAEADRAKARAEKGRAGSGLSKSKVAVNSKSPRPATQDPDARDEAAVRNDSGPSTPATDDRTGPSPAPDGEEDPDAGPDEGAEGEDEAADAVKGEPMLSDVVQLTAGFSRAGEAYFSPDMKWIIFQATPDAEEHYQMYVAPLVWAGEAIIEAGDPVRISPPNSRNTCGYFSPDGTSLIFASTAGKEQRDEPSAGYQREGRDYRWSFPEGMEIFRADDWEPAVAQSAGVVDLAKTAITDNNAYDAEGSYSPDGQWIVFCSMRSRDAELYAMRADGTGAAVRLTDAQGYDGGPFFSPDGRSIVYRSDREGNNLLQIFVADLTFDAAGNIIGATNERQLTDDANVNWAPYFHPDGRHLIYATSQHGHHNYELYLIRTDGSGRTRVTRRPDFDGLPAFSPDGKYLMWSSKRTDDDTTQVFVARFHMPAEAAAKEATKGAGK